MSEFLAVARIWFDARSQRERVVLLAAVVVGLLLSFESIVWSPARHRLAASATQLASLGQQRGVLEAELGQLEEQEALDPDAAVNRQLTSLARQVQALDDRLGGQALHLLAPERARELLQALIANVQGLRIVSIQTEAPRPLSDTGQHELPMLYRHGLVVDLQGNYLALLDYVRELERLPWRLYWLGVEVRADEPGASEFRLHLYSVSLREEWIRV